MDISVDKFNILCRLCAGETNVQERIQIFSVDDKSKDIKNKITSCLPIDVSEQDLLPKLICVQCMKKLETYYNFRECCIKSELILKESACKNFGSQFGKPSCSSDGEKIVCEPSLFFNSFENKSLDSSFKNKQDMAKKPSIETTPQTPNFLVEKINALAAKKASVISASKPSFVIHSTKKRIPLVICPRTILPSIEPQVKPKLQIATKMVLKPTETLGKPAILENRPNQVKMTMYRCKQCKVLFQTHAEFLRHVESVHEKVFKCDACDQAFNSPQSLESHQERFFHKLYVEKIRDTEPYKCDDCGKEFPHKRNLRIHEKVHLNEKPFPCTYCEKSFTSTSARNKHIQVHEKRWSHVCSYCGKGFVDRVHFKYHVQKHHTGERPFPCDQCDKKFVRKQDYNTHMLSMHSTEPRQCYKCEICGKTFTNKNYLRTHTQNHVIPLESRKKFKCNICESVFCSKKSLSQHTFSHTGELPYECDLCKKRFNNKQGLEIHLLIHSGLKTFVCEVCGKAFALRNTLICHRRTHTGERPYQCDICDQRFTQKSSLNAHRKRH